MSQSTINALPVTWQIIAYGLLVVGTIFTVGFLARYMLSLPWLRSEEGRHLVAMSANVGAFFVLYLVMAFWPEFPGRSAVRMTLFIALVINCGVRWWLLEKYLGERRRARRARSDV